MPLMYNLLLQYLLPTTVIPATLYLLPATNLPMNLPTFLPVRILVTECEYSRVRKNCNARAITGHHIYMARESTSLLLYATPAMWIIEIADLPR